MCWRVGVGNGVGAIVVVASGIPLCLRVGVGYGVGVIVVVTRGV